MGMSIASIGILIVAALALLAVVAAVIIVLVVASAGGKKNPPITGVCKNCGAALQQGSAICSKCGTNV